MYIRYHAQYEDIYVSASVALGLIEQTIYVLVITAGDGDNPATLKCLAAWRADTMIARSRDHTGTQPCQDLRRAFEAPRHARTRRYIAQLTKGRRRDQAG
jgi:hypothetical protein